MMAWDPTTDDDVYGPMRCTCVPGVRCPACASTPRAPLAALSRVLIVPQRPWAVRGPRLPRLLAATRAFVAAQGRFPQSTELLGMRVQTDGMSWAMVRALFATYAAYLHACVEDGIGTPALVAEACRERARLCTVRRTAASRTMVRTRRRFNAPHRH